MGITMKYQKTQSLFLNNTTILKLATKHKKSLCSGLSCFNGIILLLFVCNASEIYVSDCYKTDLVE